MPKGSLPSHLPYAYDPILLWYSLSYTAIKWKKGSIFERNMLPLCVTTSRHVHANTILKRDRAKGPDLHGEPQRRDRSEARRGHFFGATANRQSGRIIGHDYGDDEGTVSKVVRGVRRVQGIIIQKEKPRNARQSVNTARLAPVVRKGTLKH